MHEINVLHHDRGEAGAASRCRRGYTLVELLVVVAIIALLLALLVPTVSAVREMARLTACQHKLAANATGAIRHEDALGYLPGWLNVGPSPQGPVGWPIALLPYIEQQPVSDAFQAGGVAAVANVDIEVWLCPSSHPADLAAVRTQVSYAGNCGQGMLDRRWSGVMNDATNPANRIRIREIADGPAWTLLFAEKCGAVVGAQSLWTGTMLTGSATDAYNGRWVNDQWVMNPVATILALPTSATRTQPAFGVIYGGLGSNRVPFNNANNPHSLPSSLHVGGAAVVFCDGRTRFLRDGMDAGVYAALVTAATQRITDIEGWTPKALNDSDLRDLR